MPLILRVIITWFIVCVSALLMSPAMAIEEPAYRILKSEPPFEYRFYSGFIIAETDLDGDYDSASRSGFRRIASYIFGDNVAGTGGSRKISMTAPVTIEPRQTGWRIFFVMPSAERIDTLPKPKNPDIHLRQVTAHAAATIRFSGWTTQSSIEEQTSRLRKWMAGQGLEATGTPQIARYDDPFTLPWRRRNEIIISVKVPNGE